MKFTIEEILKATGAKGLGINEDIKNLTFTFSTDTRTIKAGEIYLPLKGENFDGEKFIEKALEAGAIGYFTTGGEIFNSAKVALKVENTLTAYLQLANFYRKKINPKTIAITGSSGKTTTKEMAYCVAKEKFKTHKSELNFNNEIGLCKTILSMPEDTEVLILEMGMRGLGEIELLSKYSEPDIAIITNVGTAHIGRLGSRENIAKAKCEIVKYMKKDGILIAHDDELIKSEMEKAKSEKISSHFSPFTFHSRFFSLNKTKILERKIGYSKLEYKGNIYELNIEGDYNIQNALAVIEMGTLLGITSDKINEGLKKYLPIEKRWEIQEIKGFKIINDSYNANPESMKGVIKTVLDIYSPPLLLVLGDMGELGENEIEYHQQIGDFLIGLLKQNQSLCHCKHSETIQKILHFFSWIASSLGLCQTPRNDTKDNIKVITVGKLAKEITKKLNANDIPSKNFDNNLQTSRYILDNVKFGTTIVLKASRSMKLEEIIQELKS